MLDEAQKKEIIAFILEESSRIKYGRLQIELVVVNGNVFDMDMQTKRKVDLRKKVINTLSTKLSSCTEGSIMI